MCLIKRNIQAEIVYKEDPKQIATEDIVCYKIMNLNNDMLISKIQNYTYGKVKNVIDKELDTIKIQPTEKFNDNNIELYIEKGYHSYDNLATTFIKINNHNSLSGAGLYALLSGEKDSNKNTVIVKCIIPKGTIYYSGENNELVSETIIIKQIIDPVKDLEIKVKE